MSRARILGWVLASIAAIAAALLLRFMLIPAVQPADATKSTMAETTVQVLAATEDLQPGTRLSSRNAAWQSWPSKALNASLITDGNLVNAHGNGVDKLASEVARSVASAGNLNGYDGWMVRETILSGEPVSLKKLVGRNSSGVMAVVLGSGMRAVSLSISAETAAGGFILPGDRVDVIYSRQINDRTYDAQTVLQNIKVLAIDQTSTASPGAKTAIGNVATLEVSAADVISLTRTQAEAKNSGILSLALRSYADIGGRQGAIAPPLVDSTGVAQSVAVYRGGVVSAVAVAR